MTNNCLHSKRGISQFLEYTNKHFTMTANLCLTCMVLILYTLLHKSPTATCTSGIVPESSHTSSGTLFQPLIKHHHLECVESLHMVCSVNISQYSWFKTKIQTKCTPITDTGYSFDKLLHCRRSTQILCC